MSEYNPEHPIQMAYSKLNTSCLCTMRESCAYCSDPAGRREMQECLADAAKAIGVALYHRVGGYGDTPEEWVIVGSRA